MKFKFILGLTVVASASICAQTLDLQPAVQLGFEAAAGKAYLIEGSSDFNNWSPAAPSIVGQAGDVERFFAGAEPKQFYRVSSTDIADLTGDLETIRVNNNLPALGCAVVMSNRVVGLGVTGVRKHGVGEPVTLEDHWHHGSMTKSMTAVLAAKLVDDGVIAWDTKLVDLFPEFAGTRNVGWNTATLEMLVTNSSGAPGDLNVGGIWSQLWNHPGTPREQRLFLVEKVTALAPNSTPGTQYEYSNAGFSMAGAMLEKATDTPWEELIMQKVFLPLGMTSAGFGVPATPRHIDHPWGHTFSGATPVPVAPGTSADNPPGIGPSATVNCSLVDFARYVAFQLAGSRGEGTWLEPSTYQKLYTPVVGGYAMGWSVTSRSWADGTVYTHTGSNTMWYTNVWIAPNKNWAVVVVTNIAGNAAATATNAAVVSMISRFLP